MKNKNTQNQNKIINIMGSTDFQLVESFKALRTNLLFSLPVKEGVNCRKILFTSSDPGEGKTTTTANLAISLAETETKVLLIDADMRKPTVHRYFHMEGRCGLSNILSGMNKLEECMQQIPELPNLTVIPSGILPPNPSELLSSSAMDKLLQSFENHFDYIIIDTPPVNAVTDALALVNRVDGVVMVIAQGHCTVPGATKAVETLRFAKANILGMVINRSVKIRQGYGKYGSYRYGAYRYGAYKKDIGEVPSKG